ncbi:MAG: type II toxin-antitoxin system VapC family toxin [Pyrinomonadaceae bacterium]
MKNIVLDSSAILAVMLQEKGSEVVEPLLDGGKVSTVNIAETFSKLAEKGRLTDSTVEDFLQLGLEIIDFDYEQAVKTAELRPLTKHLGMSLGDRSCLALAILQGATAVTADKDWKSLSFCPIEVIR